MSATLSPPPLVLASQSPYRAKALNDLGFSFTQIAPEIDERAANERDSEKLSLQLAQTKCQKVRSIAPDAVVIGCDQVGECKGVQLTKPQTSERAIEQLHLCQGNVANFYTSIAVAVPGTPPLHGRCVHTQLKFRSLSTSEIERYVALDQPLDCAGAFKVESLGILLFDEVRSEDPSALIGLPIIALSTFLREAGIDPLNT